LEEATIEEKYSFIDKTIDRLNYHRVSDENGH